MGPGGRRFTRALATALPVVTLLAGLGTLPGAPAAQAAQTGADHATAERGQAGSLDVSPKIFVGGQALTFTGKLGNGRQPIHLQFHMNRPGDSWTDVAGFSTFTHGDGTYRFTHPAPAMFNISYRVKSPRAATPAYLFHPRSQEATLAIRTSSGRAPAGSALAGSLFSVLVDTAPTLRGRPDLPGPVFPGRGMALQQRVQGNQWRTVATGKVDDAGKGRFSLRAPSLDSLTSDLVFRLKLDDYRVGANEIGWFPSFPFYVPLLSKAAARTAKPTAPILVRADQTSSTTESPTLLRGRGATPTAAGRYGWGASLYDFAWEYGESLTDRPMRGTDRRGGWVDTSDGTGRASHSNGGLLLDSKLQPGGGWGDLGTTAVTLQGNPRTYGRWEFRQRSWAMESGDADYHLVVELVPENAAVGGCSTKSITVGDVTVGSDELRLGVRSPSKAHSWTYTAHGIRRGVDAHNLAVEVAKDHISWFFDGRLLATTRDRAAVPGVPLTPRLTLKGATQGGRPQEMDHTKVIYDWMRSFSVDHGRPSTGGHRLQRGSVATGC